MSNKKFHFISGLPRSGTTLLSVILQQNPRFEASISNPLARFVRAIIQESTAQGGYGTECPPEKNKQILNGIFENYYDNPEKEVAFNVNRGWTLLLPTVKGLYPQSKVLLCVRDIAWILDSFEVLVRKNPYQFSSMFSPDENTNVYTRCESLLNPGRTLGFAYGGVKQALSSEFRSSIYLVEYDKLAKNPEAMLKSIYKFLGEEYFEHDFSDVESTHTDFDDEAGLPGLHTTRKKVEFIERKTIIPPDILNSVSNMNVWKF